MVDTSSVAPTWKDLGRQCIDRWDKGDLKTLETFDDFLAALGWKERHATMLFVLDHIVGDAGWPSFIILYGLVFQHKLLQKYIDLLRAVSAVHISNTIPSRGVFELLLESISSYQKMDQEDVLDLKWEKYWEQRHEDYLQIRRYFQAQCRAYIAAHEWIAKEMN